MIDKKLFLSIFDKSIELSGQKGRGEVNVIRRELVKVVCMVNEAETKRISSYLSDKAPALLDESVGEYVICDKCKASDKHRKICSKVSCLYGEGEFMI